MTDSTLIATSFQSRKGSRPCLVEDPPIGALPDGASGARRFKIKVADTTHRSLASRLLHARYLWRGYRSVHLAAEPDLLHCTLVAVENNDTIGTITVAMDGPQGLAADAGFASEMASLRRQGSTLCEFTKLAIDTTVGSKRVLASLFHVAYIVAYRMRSNDRLVIEVNPRHVSYYERMLGLQVVGSERMNLRVNAPAVLMSCSFSSIMDQIERVGGQPELMTSERSLFPLAFSPSEEAAIIDRLTVSRFEPAQCAS